MLNLNFDLSARRNHKIEQAIKKHGRPCVFYPVEGKEFDRTVNIAPSTRDRSVEYVTSPYTVAEFIKSEGSIQSDDRFLIDGTMYKLTEVFSADAHSVSFMYVEV
ncbi:hypothetical protein D5018_03945 [Parashewanella curva]|uniref:Uncharacterized protein n=1 Tax=Parashewanella curva TaxID=2338552 RepID=A0A3L8Q340_9GAMM|nr:hypothetical protein [Parashewanella curva]RLV61002.1 hypothetical protein D5018_03945 [Parashewanella curva]